MTFQNFRLALFPSAMDPYRAGGYLTGNSPLINAAQEIKYSRTVLYFAVATTILATSAAMSNEEDSTRKHTYATIAALGIGMSMSAGKILYDATQRFLDAVEQRRQQHIHRAIALAAQNLRQAVVTIFSAQSIKPQLHKTSEDSE